MKNKIIALTFLLTLLTISSSCSLLGQDSNKLLTEKKCQKTCLIRGKTYIGYDSDLGCYCGNF